MDCSTIKSELPLLGLKRNNAKYRYCILILWTILLFQLAYLWHLPVVSFNKVTLKTWLQGTTCTNRFLRRILWSKVRFHAVAFSGQLVLSHTACRHALQAHDAKYYTTLNKFFYSLQETLCPSAVIKKFCMFLQRVFDKLRNMSPIPWWGSKNTLGGHVAPIQNRCYRIHFRDPKMCTCDKENI